MGRKYKTESAQQAAQKWAANYAASGPAIQAGVAQPRQDPTAAAIAQQTTLVQNFNQAVTSGAWANGLRKAGLAGWQTGMTKKTIPSLATRAQAGADHYQAFRSQWNAFLDSTLANLPARGTYEQNMQRARAMADAEHGQRGKFRKLWRGGGA